MADPQQQMADALAEFRAALRPIDQERIAFSLQAEQARASTPLVAYAEVSTKPSPFSKIRPEELQQQEALVNPGPPVSNKACCLYPGPELADYDDGNYVFPLSDLPQTVMMNGKIMTFQGSLGGQIRYTSDTDDQQLEAQGGGWNSYFLADEAGLPGGISLCLIGSYGNGYPVTDFFSSTYTVNGTDTITRATGMGGVASCMWTGAKTGGGMWKLDYGQTTPYTWHLTGGNPSPSSDDKTSPQSSPVGSFGANSVA